FFSPQFIRAVVGPFLPLAHFRRKTLRQDDPGTTSTKSVDLDHPPNLLPYSVRIYSPHVFTIAVLRFHRT
ncbi:MAG TPA: hypothetical protein VF772_05145, partial [Terriglobales bacterium]